MKELFVSSPTLLGLKHFFLFRAGFQAIPALANLEGLLNSLASPSDADENAVPLPQQAKAPSSVQQRGTLGFLQGFLKLQQAMQHVQSAQDQSQACFTIPCSSSYQAPLCLLLLYVLPSLPYQQRPSFFLLSGSFLSHVALFPPFLTPCHIFAFRLSSIGPACFYPLTALSGVQFAVTETTSVHCGFPKLRLGWGKVWVLVRLGILLVCWV